MTKYYKTIAEFMKDHDPKDVFSWSSEYAKIQEVINNQKEHLNQKLIQEQLELKQKQDLFKKTIDEIPFFNQIPTQFDIKKLNKFDILVLHHIEARSLDLNGDTKILDSRLQKLMGKSRSTIQRTLNKLSKNGFINILTKRYRDFRRRKDGKSEYYCDRVIRCNRVVIQKQFNILQNPRWKSDPRPKWNSNIIVDRTGYPIKYELIDPHSVKDTGKLSFRGSYEWYCSIGIGCKEMMDVYRHYNDLRHEGKGKGLELLGYYRESYEKTA